GRAPLLVFVAEDGSASVSAITERTIARYRENGVVVDVIDRGGIEDWIQKRAPEVSDADDPFRFLAFARSAGADAIGGLHRENLGWPTTGEFVRPWIINLARCTVGALFECSGTDISGVVPDDLELVDSSDVLADRNLTTPCVERRARRPF